MAMSEDMCPLLGHSLHQQSNHVASLREFPSTEPQALCAAAQVKADLWLQNNPTVPVKTSWVPFDTRHSISSYALCISGQALAHSAVIGASNVVISCNWRAFWVKASSGSTEATKEAAAPRSKNAKDAIAASTRDVVDTSTQGQIASQIGAKSSAEKTTIFSVFSSKVNMSSTDNSSN